MRCNSFGLPFFRCWFVSLVFLGQTSLKVQNTSYLLEKHDSTTNKHSASHVIHAAEQVSELVML